MKIFSADSIRSLDADTIRVLQIESHELMERAARVFSAWFRKHMRGSFRRILICCGTGNNGGDGLCIARHLWLAGHEVHVLVSGKPEDACSDDFRRNRERLLRMGFDKIHYGAEGKFPDPGPEGCIIDAIFGTGLNRAPSGEYAALIGSINSSEAFVISVDVPSGLYTDKPTESLSVQADITFAFEFPRLGFFFPENQVSVGTWIVESIGIPSSLQEEQTPLAVSITEKEVAPLLQIRGTFTHKGSFGHSLIIAGKAGMRGAAALCGLSCLVTGSGLVTYTADGEMLPFPELMTTAAEDCIREIRASTYQAIAIGPGLGKSMGQKQLLADVLNAATCPLVLDADALNILAETPDMCTMIPENSILTPHPKEFSRLFGVQKNWQDLLDTLRNKAVAMKCSILYKRAYTITATPEGNLFFNNSGNPGMATAGAGDVLTGMITGMLAQGYLPEEAAIAGVFLHGLAGDLAMHRKKGQNIIAGDLIDSIQEAYGLLM